MGYELRIERSDSAIERIEWCELVSKDSELSMTPEWGPDVARYLGDCEYGYGEGWLAWDDGRIVSKSPDDAILSKMLGIADCLNASIRGDDGESYTEPDINSALPAPRISQFRRLCTRLKSWFCKGFTRKSPTALPFVVGDRVDDPSTGRGQVIFIDQTADHGLGVVRVRYDDGRELSCAAIVHGLRKLSDDDQ